MQVIELNFNPKKRRDLCLTSFIYTPADIYEKRLGNLYMAGELTRILPSNIHFLTNLSAVIKREYYSSGLKRSCQESLESALKKANEFLEQESKKDNVGWLGNLHFSVIAFKDSVLNFAEVGDLKIFLVRGNELIDLSQNLAGVPIHPDPLKIFGRYSFGKIAEGDRIIVLNKKFLASLGKKQKFLGELAQASQENEFKQILKTYQDLSVHLAGICLILIAKGEKDSKQTVSLPNDYWPKFKLPKVRFPEVKLPEVKLPRIIRPKLPRIPRLPKIEFKVIRKKILLVVSLILILASFYYIFRDERAQELSDAQTRLNEAQTKVILAESLLILKENDKARALFEESLDILDPLTKRGSPLRQEALSLKNSINQYLK